MDPIETELRAVIDELLPALGDRAADVGDFAAHVAEELAMAYGRPGWALAVQAGRDRVLLHAAVQAVHAGEAADAAVRRTLVAALRIAAAAWSG